MLDIFGNVFGRSKKNQSNHSSNASDQENNDGFIVLGQTNCEQSMMAHIDDPPPIYPTTILTDYMIRLGATASSSVSTVQSQCQTSHGVSSSSVISRTHTHQRMNSYSSPIDCVPFTASTATFGCGIDSVNSSTHSEDKCLAIIDRIGQYLSTPSQSEYSFNLENSILSESLLCYHKN